MKKDDKMGNDDVKKYDDSNFIMSPKIDFVFKLIFGNEKNKDILIALLSSIIDMPEEEFKGIEIINNELMREFKEDKKGILDVRVKTKSNKQIDIEIQILPTEYMPERTLYYWSKMYTEQIKSGDTYDMLKKCIAINIVDFRCIPLKKLHTVYHIKEEKSGYALTDILEIHFIELPKLTDNEIEEGKDEPITQWMEFIDGKSKGVMEMLAKKNEDIKKAYDILKIVSQDEKARMVYEAREAEIKDQLTRIKSARKKGIEDGIKKGIEKGVKDVAKNLLEKGMKAADIAEVTGLTVSEINQLLN